MDGFRLDQVGTEVMGDYIFIACTKRGDRCLLRFVSQWKVEAGSSGLTPGLLSYHFQSSTGSLFLTWWSFCFSIPFLLGKIPTEPQEQNANEIF